MKRTMKNEALVAMLLSCGYLYFAMKVYMLLRTFTSWIVQTMPSIDTRVDKISVENLDVFTGISVFVIFIVFLIYLFVNYRFTKNYNVNRPFGIPTFITTVFMLMSTHFVTFIIHFILAALAILGGTLGVYSPSSVYEIVGGTLILISVIFYIVLLIVSSNTQMENSKQDMHTGLGIGESIYKYWWDYMLYKSSYSEKQHTLNSYKQETHLI